MLQYLNISSEEFFLHQNGFITDEIWEIWENSIKQTLEISKKFNDFWWKKGRRNYLDKSGQETAFVRFIDNFMPKQQGSTEGDDGEPLVLKED
jgi:hypothetical protein